MIWPFKLLFNRGKRAFYGRYIRTISNKIWDKELSIITINEIREGIRREFDKLEGGIKSSEEEIEKLLKLLDIEQEPKLLANLRKDLEAVRKEVPQVDGLNEETRDKVIEGINKETNSMRRVWLREHSKILVQDVKENRENNEKIVTQALMLIDVVGGLRTDAEKMKEQMMGRWSEDDQAYVGGFDQEIKSVEQKIDAGLLFKSMIEKERRKL